MTDNKEDRLAFIARHPKFDNPITYLLQSDEGLKLAKRIRRDEAASDQGE